MKKVPDVLLLILKRVYFGTSEMGSIKFVLWWVWLVLTLFHPFVVSHASSKLGGRANINGYF